MSHNMNLEFYQTGRTTRTREKVIELADQGFVVYVFMQTLQMARREEECIEGLWKRLHRFDKASGIKVEAFDRNWAIDWDWRLMQPKSRFHDSCRFLMDHTVVEAEISRQREIVKQAVERISTLYPFTV